MTTNIEALSRKQSKFGFAILAVMALAIVLSALLRKNTYTRSFDFVTLSWTDSTWTRGW